MNTVDNVSTVKPRSPWKASPKDRAKEGAIFLGTIVATYLIVLFSPLSGKLGSFVTFFFLYAAAQATSSYLKFGAMTAKDSAIKVLMACGAILTVFPIISILATVVSKGYKGIKWNIFTNDMSLATVTDPLEAGGLLHAIVGTLLMISAALVLSVPIGILTALYLTEIRGRFSRPIRFLVQAMSGVPSIVAGLFILSAVLYTITKSSSGLMGSLALSILMIPTVARTSEEVLKLIPEDLREAGTALGGTQWRTVAMIVLPAAKSGLMTAVILGVARIAGETAPLLLLTGGGDTLNFNLLNDPMGSLPFYIWKSFLAGSEEANTRAWAGLLVLIVLILILFTTARFLSSRKVSR
jgi:phosphate transport system permease protein